MPRRSSPRARSAEEMLESIGRDLAYRSDEPNLLRYRPHPKQVEFHGLAAKHRLFLGGNRSGKSVGGTTEGLYHARGAHPWRHVPPPPARGRVVGTDFVNGVELVLLPLWAQWTPPSLLVNGSWEDSYHHGIDGRLLTLANGSTVQFMSYEQDVKNFAGRSLHWVHFDEEPPKDIYDECRARVIDTDGDWWMTLTPVLGLDHIYDGVYKPGVLARDHPELLTPEMLDSETGLPLFGVVEVESYENTHLKRSALDGFFNTLDEASAKTRRQGAFIQVTGAMFPDFHRSRHVVGAEDFRLRHGYHRVYVSIDNGWRDHTAVLWHAVDPFGNVTTFDELYVNETLIVDIVAQVKRINAQHGLGEKSAPFKPYVYVGDPRGLAKRNEITGTNARMEFGRLGIGIATEGINGDVEHGVRRIAQYLRHTRAPGYGGYEHPDIPTPKWLIVGERCPNLVRQLEKNRWKRRPKPADEASMNKLVEAHQADNHATDSARFFFVMMPDLEPKSTEKTRSNKRMAHAADMLGAVNPDSRRDLKVSKRPGWSYRATASVGELDGWEEG